MLDLNRRTQSLFRSITGYLLVLSIAFLQISCGSSGGTTQSNNNGSQTGTIQGVVTASSSIAFKAHLGIQRVAYKDTVGVPDAVCTIGGTNKSVTSDQNGFFKITNVTSGSYILICRKTASDGNVYAFLSIVEVQDGQTIDLGMMEISQTGSIQGKANLYEQTDHTGINFYIPGTSLQATTDSSGNYFLSGVPSGTYILYYEKAGYTTGKLSDIVVTTDDVAMTEDVTLNLSTGATGSINIENGKNYSNSLSVKVYISASANAALYQLSDSPNFIGAVWKPIPPWTTWAFDSDGEKKLYIKFADTNGLESAPVSDSITIDIVSPAGGVFINNTATATNSANVMLNLSAVDLTSPVYQMKISNDPAMTDVLWETFYTTHSWTFPGEDGVKTVYVKLRDIAGNESQTITASIFLDRIAPQHPTVYVEEGSAVNSNMIHLIISDTDASRIRISEDPQFMSYSTVPLKGIIPWSLSIGDGIKTLYVKFLDDAGNETVALTISLTMDTTPPSVPTVVNTTQILQEATCIMTLMLPSTDIHFKTYQIKGGQYADWTDTSETDSFSFSLPDQGFYTLYVRGKDLFGNVGPAAAMNVIFDISNPTLSDIRVHVTDNAATITWFTDELTNALVDFGTTADYGSIQKLSLGVYSVILSGLTENTLYHYQITVTDPAGNSVKSGDRTFHTGKNVSGVISSNVTWTSSDGPVIIKGDTLVSEGVTLTIEPAVEVKFDGFFTLRVEGELIAIGTPSEKIQFSSNQVNPFPGDWKQIWFVDNSVDAFFDGNGNYLNGSTIQYAEIAFGGTLLIDHSAPYIHLNHIHDMKMPSSVYHTSAIHLCNSGSIVSNNIVENNKISGIGILGYGPQVINNTIRNNSAVLGGGIYIGAPFCSNGYSSGTESNNPVVQYNVIDGNTARYGGGMNISIWAIYKPVIRYNDIINNKSTLWEPICSLGNPCIQGGGSAISFYGIEGSPDISYNNIAGNLGNSSNDLSTAILFDSDLRGHQFKGMFHNNNIVNDTTYEVYLAYETTTDVDLTNNYWGTSDLSTLGSSIFDKFDDFGRGKVILDPILDSLVPGAGYSP